MQFYKYRKYPFRFSALKLDLKKLQAYDINQ